MNTMINLKKVSYKKNLLKKKNQIKKSLNNITIINSLNDTIVSNDIISCNIPSENISTIAMFQENKIMRLLTELINNWDNKIINELINATNWKIQLYNQKKDKNKMILNTYTEDLTSSTLNFINKKIILTKQTNINFLELSLEHQYLHIFYYHRNTSISPYIVTDAFIFGEQITLKNLKKIQSCLHSLF